MYCQNCGEKLPEGAKFCSNCGNPVNDSNNGSNNSTQINFDKIADDSIGAVKSGANDFKNEWANWSSKKKFLSLIACCCIGLIIISGVIGFLTPDKNAELFDSSNEGKNISLIKESTSGYVFHSMTNKTVYQYDLKGVLKNIPKDSKGFTVRGTFYDNNGQVIKDVDTHLDYYSYYTEKSEPTSIASLQNYEFVNVSKIQLTIMNPDGNVVFDKSYDYDMDKFDLSGLDDKLQAADNHTDLNNDSFSSNHDSNSSSTGRSRIEQLTVNDGSSSSSSSSSGVTYVGSVNSDKFHYPSCSQAKRIKDGNKITFSSRDDAIASGYSPCGICTP